jgi:hypothetical protein
VANSDWSKLRKALREFGCEERMGGNGSHIKIYFQGRLISSLPGTPGDNRAMANTLGELRRRLDGFDFRTKQVRRRADETIADEYDDEED